MYWLIILLSSNVEHARSYLPRRLVKFFANLTACRQARVCMISSDRAAPQPTAYSLQQTAYSIQPTVNSQQHTTYGQQPTAYRWRKIGMKISSSQGVELKACARALVSHVLTVRTNPARSRPPPSASHISFRRNFIFGRSMVMSISATTFLDLGERNWSWSS